jgi:hypothetical protein
LSKLAIYEGIKPVLEAVTSVRGDGSTMTIKYVGIWRNNLDRENEENPTLYPAVFVEFLPSNFMELSKGLQSYDLTTRLHIVFESMKDEDTDILRLVQNVYNAVQFKQYGYAGKMKRRNEEQDFDHTNVQDYIQDYDCGKVMEFGGDNRPTTEATIDDIVVNGQSVAGIDTGIGTDQIGTDGIRTTPWIVETLT